MAMYYVGMIEFNPKFYLFTSQPLRAVGLLFSPMVGGRAAGRRLSGLYLGNRKV